MFATKEERKVSFLLFIWFSRLFYGLDGCVGVVKSRKENVRACRTRVVEFGLLVRRSG